MEGNEFKKIGLEELGVVLGVIQKHVSHHNIWGAALVPGGWRSNI